MPHVQTDLFAQPDPPPAPPDEAIVRMVRKRLHKTLALVKAAETMPWGDVLAIIREDNEFRFAKDLLPAEEGAALWAEFDREMDRLYAVMNEGQEPDEI